MALPSERNQQYPEDSFSSWGKKLESEFLG